MTDVLWPTNIIPSSQTWGVVDNVGVNQSPLAGSIRTVARTGARMKCTITLPPLKGQDRARMMAFIGALRGRSNRGWIPDFSTTLRGSFPATEVLTTDFSSTTGWQTSANWSLSATDGVMRVTRINGSVEADITPSSSLTVTRYAPYVARVMVLGARSLSEMSGGLYVASSAVNNSDASTPLTIGMKKAAIVADTTALTPYFYDASTSTAMGGSYADVGYMSVSRCILADNGPNTLLQSDTFNTTWTPANCTVTVDLHTAPNGTVTADSIIESGATNVEHYVFQSITVASAAADITFSVTVAAITRSWCVVRLIENTGSAQAYAFVNLATGAIGTTNVTSANWTNLRAVVVSQGNGWYRITVTARKTNAATSVSCFINSATADASFTYAGSASTDAISLWRACASVGSLPTRGAQTTTTATSGTAQTGSGIYVKGLPVSTSGLLKAGDMVQLGNQINIVTAPLDSDAAGLGYLQCGNPWRASIADNDPIIVNTPMAKMILASEDMSWETGPGQFSPFQLEFIEDVT